MMKRIVGKDWSLALVAAAVITIIVAVTGAGAGATYLITFGVMAIFGVILGRDELEELWGEKLRRLLQRARLVRR